MLGTTAEGGAGQEQPTGEVRVNRALNAAPENVNAKRAQELLDKLKEHQWLVVVSTTQWPLADNPMYLLEAYQTKLKLVVH